MKHKTRKKVVRRKRRSMTEKRIMRLKRGLKKRAKKLRLGAKRTGAYVYGTLRRIVGNPGERYRVGGGYQTFTLEEAKKEADKIFRKTGAIVSITEHRPAPQVKPDWKYGIYTGRGIARNRSLRRNEGLGYTSYIPESGFLVAKTTGYHDTPSGKFQLLKKGQVLRILFTTKERRGGGTTGKEYFVAETTDHPYEGMKVLVEKGYAGKIYNSDPRKSSSRYGNRLMGNRRLGKEEQKALNFARKYPGWHGFNPRKPTADVVRRLAKKGLIELSDVSNQFREIRKNPPMYAHGMTAHRTHGLSLKQMMKLYRLVSSGNPKAVMFARRTLGIPMSESLSQVKAVVYHHVMDLREKM